MKVKALTLHWRGIDGFDTAALDTFVAEHDIVAVSDHWFMHEGEPAWAILLTHRPAPRVASFPKPSDVSAQARTELTSEERFRYEALRKWRNERARTEGKPPYVYFTNNQMLAIACDNPTTKTALGTVYGVGDAKLEAYGEAIVALLAAIPSGSMPPSVATSGDGQDGE